MRLLQTARFITTAYKILIYKVQLKAVRIQMT